MKNLLTTFALVAVGFACMANAQSSSTSSSASPVTVTGCLAQGADASEFTIRDSNGKTYDLMSSKVNLKSHLNHEISVTGTPTTGASGSRANTGGSSSGSSAMSSSGANERIEVSDVKMISTTCK
jgi:hypothetical protein